VRRVALALALLHAGAVAADEPALTPPRPPVFMPSAPPPPTPRLLRQSAQLRHDAFIFGALALGFAAAGIAVDVVALDLPQGERVVPTGGGNARIERFRDDANWAEFALGTALVGVGVAFGYVALFRLRSSKRLVQ
jgi:hypothetical protein